MIPQRESIIRLLSDEDTDTAELVERQLVARGSEILPDLHELLSSATGRIERRLRETIFEIERGIAVQKVGAICSAFGEGSDIEQAAWGIADALFSGEDFSVSKVLLEKWGAELRRRLPEAQNVDEQHEILQDFIGAELGFRGNEDDYYAMENSILPKVIELRLGNPITLTLVYIIIAKRAGLNVSGVGMPGHFIARMEHVFFDPFHGGRRMTLDECRKLMESQDMELHPHHLHPCPQRAMLVRILNNIRHVANEDCDQESSAAVQVWMDALQHGVK
jgi:regulator of sirC expression with transglutaminase-like and TPR domain